MEQLRLILRGDTDAGIPDDEFHALFVLQQGNVESHPTAFRGEFHGIGKQIHQDLLTPSRIRHEPLRLVINLTINRDLLGRRLGAHENQATFAEFTHVDRLEMEVDFGRLDFGQIQDIIDQ